MKEIVNELSEYLLNSPLGKHIAKIILFGSYAKGLAKADSDIDVLIVLSDGLSIEKGIMDEVYEFMLEKDVPIETVITSVSDLFFYKDYFLYNVMRYGEEVYSMEEHKIKMAAIKEIINLAEEYLESAEEVLEKGRVRLAIDAGYNAAELATKGLILLKQDDLPGSHGGVVSLLGQLYVKTGEIDKEIGRSLNIALKLRNEARYRPNAMLRKEDAYEVLNLARRLIDIVDEKIGE